MRKKAINQPIMGFRICTSQVHISLTIDLNKPFVRVRIFFCIIHIIPRSQLSVIIYYYSFAFARNTSRQDLLSSKVTIVPFIISPKIKQLNFEGLDMYCMVGKKPITRFNMIKFFRNSSKN